MKCCQYVCAHAHEGKPDIDEALDDVRFALCMYVCMYMTGVYGFEALAGGSKVKTFHNPLAFESAVAEFGRNMKYDGKKNESQAAVSRLELVSSYADAPPHAAPRKRK